jgi:SAM-dependent methyltransferase
MSSPSVSATLGDLRAIYDKRYAGDYRESLTGYEYARFRALRHFIPHVAKASNARRVLDYGCGSGLHIPLWESVFPEAELHFADLSGKAIEKLRARHPRHTARTSLIENDRLASSTLTSATPIGPIGPIRSITPTHAESTVPANSFDAIVSIEVMEHVEHLDRYLAEIHRLLAPGGIFIWTTPCANALSIEHLYNILTRQIDPTPNGSRRWRWEDPTHLRRLTSAEASTACTAAGFEPPRFRLRAHFFSFVCTKLMMKHWPRAAGEVMRLDYECFRCLPNGASMIGAARRGAVV